MKPNYKNININAIPKHSGLILPNGEPWETSEHIMVKPAYTEKDLEGMEHLGLSVSTPVSPPLRSQTPSTAVISRLVRKVCPWPSTWPPTVATTPITSASWATWVRLV